MAILRRDMRKRALMGGGGARSAAKRRAPNRSGAAAQQNCRWSKPVEQAFDSVRRGARGPDEVGVEIARPGAVRFVGYRLDRGPRLPAPFPPLLCHAPPPIHP